MLLLVDFILPLFLPCRWLFDEDDRDRFRRRCLCNDDEEEDFFMFDIFVVLLPLVMKMSSLPPASGAALRSL